MTGSQFLYRVLVLLAVCVTTVGQAHELGVVNATFTELGYRGDGGQQSNSGFHHYSLSVAITESTAFGFTQPVLPDGCSLNSMSDKRQATLERRFLLACDMALNYHHQLILHWPVSAVLVQAHWQESPIQRTLFIRDKDRTVLRLSRLGAAGTGWWQSARAYFRLGVAHIALGFDHLLFVLGMMLLVSGLFELLKLITAFTLAHSLTLALTVSGYLSFPVMATEAAIALSLVFLAREIVARQLAAGSGKQSEHWLLAGCFGLLHGMGFAGALMDLQVPATEIPPALLFFNLGVEAGQVAFILLVGAAGAGLPKALPLAYSDLADSGGYRLPLGCLIGVTGMYWTMERASGVW